MAQLPTTISVTQPQPSLSPADSVRGYDNSSMARSEENAAGATVDLGNQVQQSTDVVKQRIDANAVLDAQNRMNAAQQAATKFLYDPDTGLLNQKGANAMGATQKAQQYLQTLRDTTMQDVTNRVAARALNKDFTASIINPTLETAQRHESAQRIDYASALAQDQVNNDKNAVGLEYNNDKLFNQKMGSTAAAVMAQGKIDGLPTDDRILQAQSDLWQTRIQNASDSTDPGTIALAGKYYAQAKAAGQLTAVAASNLGTKLKAVVPEAQSQVFFSQHRNDLLTAAMPPDQLYNDGQVGPPSPALVNAVANQESGGKDYNPDGTLVTSPKGAQGKMQVMPATGAKPGYGVKPSDGTPADNDRMGRDYLAAMVNKYGDNTLALAAYNAGPGTVDAAIAKIGNDPQAVLAAMPAETRNYVPNVLKSAANMQINGGVGYDPATLQTAADKLPPAQRSYFLAKAQDDHNKIVNDWKTGQTAAIDAAQTALANSNGNISAVPPQVRADAMKYGVWPVLSQTLGKSDPTMLNQLSGMNTTQLIATDFNDPNLRLRLSSKDLQDWQKKQSDIVTNPANEAMQRSIDGGLRYAFQTDNILNPVTGVPVTEDQLDALKRRTDNPNAFVADSNGDGGGTTAAGNPSTPDRNNAALYDKFLRVKQIVQQRVIADYNGGNKQAATPDNIRNIINQTLIDDATGKERQVAVVGTHDLPGPNFFSDPIGATKSFFSPAQAPNVKGISDLRTSDIPPATRQNIESFLQSRDMPVNDAAVLDTYMKTLVHNSRLGPYAASQRKANPNG